MGRFIPDTLIEEVRNRADIVEVIGAAVPLRKAGANYKGLCPFHSEKTPSFMVSPAKQIFHCFGCGEGGNVFHFHMRKDGISFSEAVHLIADRYSILIPHTSSAGKKYLSGKEIFTLNERFTHLYHDLLIKNPQGKKARAYIEKRGISITTAAEFKLGYVPPTEAKENYRSVTADISQKVVESAGLFNFYRNKMGNRFSGRLLFPIEDYRGRIVGFGGRALEEGQNPKYLNSPETPVYHKSSVLFNLHRAKEAIKETDYFIIVEGYLDLITTYEAGFKSVVAPLGTALTTGQVKLLKRFTRKAILAFDGDAAGLKAAFRGVEVLMEGGMNCSVVSLPPGEDPDSIIRKKGASAFKERLEQAMDEVAFFHHYSAARHDLSKAAERIAAVEELLPVIGKEKNTLRTDEYLRRLSDVFKLNEAALRTEFGKKSAKRFKPGSHDTDNMSGQPSGEKYPDERDLTQLLLLFPREIRSLFVAESVVGFFESVNWASLANFALQQTPEILDEPGKLVGLIESKDIRETASALLLVDDKENLWENPKEAFVQLLVEKKRRRNLSKLNKIQQEFAGVGAEEEGKLLQEIDRLNRENQQLRESIQ